MRGFTVHINDNGAQGTATEPLGENVVAKPAPDALAGAEPGPSSEPVSSERAELRGQIVDRYRVVKLMAVGGTARVYEAVHQFTQKPVALKITRGRLAARRDVLERFRQEAMALSSLRHENIVAVENAGLTEDGRVFIAMELLRGKTLRASLAQRGTLSQEETISLMLGVASGVSAAHEGGVIHRDLKPENIFCVLHGSVKVLDFGTAKFGGDNAPSIQTALGRVVGTVAYMAPERFEGSVGDVRSDVYALGLITYECLAGFHPMAPNGKWPSAVEMASLQVSCEPMPIPGIAPELWQVIDRAIQKTPSRRHQSAKAFVLALRNARLSTTPGRLGSRKHKVGPLFVPVVAGALCGMSASGLAQWVLWSRSQDTRATVHVEANVLGMPPGSTLVSGRPERSAVPVSVAQPTSAQALHLVAPESTSTPNDGATSSRTSCAAPTAQEGRPARRVGANSRAAPRPTQNENRPNPLNGYESAPGSHSPKDDLPASGL